MKSKKIVSLLLAGTMTAALLAIPAQAAEAVPIRVNSYKGRGSGFRQTKRKIFPISTSSISKRFPQ